MFRPEIKRKRNGVPILSKKEIDIIGEELVRDYKPDALRRPQEIDIDSFVQDYLGMDQDFKYLSHCGLYLGMTVFNDTDKVPIYDPQNKRADYIRAKAHTVIIDQTLLADNQQHRYRFTMGHEGAHDFLHTEYYAHDPNQMMFFDFVDVGQEPMIQCRMDNRNITQSKVWSDKDWMEWQANALSSAILMPKSMVEMLADLGSRRKRSPFWSYVFIWEVSKVFNVSLEAAIYRVRALDLISPNEQYDPTTINFVMKNNFFLNAGY